jgi:hypothetical protein
MLLCLDCIQCVSDDMEELRQLTEQAPKGKPAWQLAMRALQIMEHGESLLISQHPLTEWCWSSPWLSELLARLEERAANERQLEGMGVEVEQDDSDSKYSEASPSE